MWSDFGDFRVRRKKTWSEAHINTIGVLYGALILVYKRNFLKEEKEKVLEIMGEF
jgi:hypothetical protein